MLTQLTFSSSLPQSFSVVRKISALYLRISALRLPTVSQLVVKMGCIDLDLQGHLAISAQKTAFNVVLVHWTRPAKGFFTSQSALVTNCYPQLCQCLVDFVCLSWWVPCIIHYMIKTMISVVWYIFIYISYGNINETWLTCWIISGTHFGSSLCAHNSNLIKLCCFDINFHQIRLSSMSWLVQIL